MVQRRCHDEGHSLTARPNLNSRPSSPYRLQVSSKLVAQDVAEHPALEPLRPLATCPLPLAPCPRPSPLAFSITSAPLSPTRSSEELGLRCFSCGGFSGAHSSEFTQLGARSSQLLHHPSQQLLLYRNHLFTPSHHCPFFRSSVSAGSFCGTAANGHHRATRVAAACKHGKRDANAPT